MIAIDKDKIQDGPIHVTANASLEDNPSNEGLTMGTIYDMNKNLVKQTCKPLSLNKIRNLCNNVKTFATKTENEYFMMLCHEERDYTVFKIEDISMFPSDLMECLTNRGDIVSIEPTEDKQAYEIWIDKGEEEPYCYYFFPYDAAIVVS